MEAACRPAFSVVDGGRDTPATYPPSARLWQCHTCRADIGVATTTMTTVTVGAFINEDGDIVGGSEQVACAHCLARGKLTEVR